MQQNLKIAELSQYLSSAEELIEEARNGRMFILVDDEDNVLQGTYRFINDLRIRDGRRVDPVTCFFVHVS